MATTNINYGANTTITISPASIASSASFVAGQESTQIDNTTNKFDDVIVSGKSTVGTTPVVNTIIAIYVWGSNISLATTPIDVLDGTDSAETLTNTGVLNSALVIGATIKVLAVTSNITYAFVPFSVAQLFGGSVPKFWGLFVAHNTGVALNATAGNHVFEYYGVKHDVV